MKEQIMMVINSLNHLYRAIFCQSYSTNNINYSVKYEGKNKGQYGYYINKYIPELIEILEEYKVKSFIDLGSGAGILMYVISLFYLPFKNDNSKIKGYEIEESLINIANRLLYNSTTNKDILTLTKDNISRYQCIYFWEPLNDRTLAKKFVDNLTKIISKDQIIIYYCSGYILNYFEKSNKYIIERRNMYYIIKLKP